jgi:hypothetical protein
MVRAIVKAISALLEIAGHLVPHWLKKKKIGPIDEEIENVQKAHKDPWFWIKFFNR